MMDPFPTLVRREAFAQQASLALSRWLEAVSPIFVCVCRYRRATAVDLQIVSQ